MHFGADPELNMQRNPDELVEELATGMLASERPWGYLKSEPPALKAILKLDRTLLPAVAARVTQRGAESDFDRQTSGNLNELAQRIMLRKIDWDEQSLIVTARALAKQMDRHGLGPEMSPANGLLRIVERQYADGIPDDVTLALEALAASYEKRSNYAAAIRDYARRLRGVLRANGTAPPLAGDRWADAIATAIETGGFSEGLAIDLLRRCARATTVEPAASFRDAIEMLQSDHGRKVGLLAAAGIEAATAVPHDENFGGIPPATGDLLRGLVWVAEQCLKSEACDGLAALAIYGWTKIRYFGPASTKVANAAIDALARLNGSERSLAYVASMVQQPTAVERVETALHRAAERSGIPVWLMIETGLPDFGTENGARRFEIGECAVTWRIAENAHASRSIEDATGRKLRALPARTEREHKSEIDEMKLWKRRLQEFASTQRLRLERQLCSSRERTLEHWTQHYANHGVLRVFVTGLVWELRAGRSGDWRQLLWAGERFEDHDGNTRSLEAAADISIRLWNPVTAPEDERTLWRLSQAGSEHRQPFKQIERETYRPTTAEAKRTSLTRFSGLDFTQKRLMALCGERGWRYKLLGYWDSEFAGPYLLLDELDLRVDLDLDEEATEQIRRPEDDFGSRATLVTGGVRFSCASDGMPLLIGDVDPRAFSESLRDLDLFASVCTKD